MCALVTGVQTCALPITQSKIAIGSGGLFGKGFNNGSQSHLNYLPEPHTDFVFATMAEEWGLMGRSEEHTSELQSLMRISYAGFCLKKKQDTQTADTVHTRVK